MGKRRFKIVWDSMVKIMNFSSSSLAQGNCLLEKYSSYVPGTELPLSPVQTVNLMSEKRRISSDFAFGMESGKVHLFYFVFQTNKAFHKQNKHFFPLGRKGNYHI